MTDFSIDPIAPALARYIKLGAGDAWFDSGRSNDRIELGHNSISHELAMSGDKDAIAAVYLEQGREKITASRYAREVMEFYHSCGDDCLWVTFADGHLWWAFAKTEVLWLGETQTHGARYRELFAPWCKTDIRGAALTIDALSSKLTQTSRTEHTLCEYKAIDALVRRINTQPDPYVTEAKEARDALIPVATKLVEQLDWRDFEVLVDLIFARSGWQRVGELGGSQKDTDLVIEQIATSELAAVQVKSKATNRELAKYVDGYKKSGNFDRLFFVCHTGKLTPPDDPRIHVWTGKEVAKKAVQAGLLDWLIEMAV